MTEDKLTFKPHATCPVHGEIHTAYPTLTTQHDYSTVAESKPICGRCLIDALDRAFADLAFPEQ